MLPCYRSAVRKVTWRLHYGAAGQRLPKIPQRSNGHQIFWFSQVPKYEPHYVVHMYVTGYREFPWILTKLSTFCREMTWEKLSGSPHLNNSLVLGQDSWLRSDWYWANGGGFLEGLNTLGFSFVLDTVVCKRYIFVVVVVKFGVFDSTNEEQIAVYISPYSPYCFCAGWNAHVFHLVNSPI